VARPVIGLFVAVVLLVSGARAHCLFSCANPERGAPASGCHDEPAPGLTVSAAHVCAGETLTPTPAVKRAGADLTFTALAAIVTTAARPPLAGVALPAIRHSSASPPRLPALVPLRI
jgi:hypothetical protein